MLDPFRIVPMILSLMLSTAYHSAPQSPGIAVPPNIIHILADDLGYDDLGCYGATAIQTPYLDQLATEGTCLTGFYAPHSSGTSSRAAILTGRYAPRLNKGKGLPQPAPDSRTGLDPASEVTIAQLLRSNGYTTGIVGTWQLGHLTRYLPVNLGFDHFLGIPCASDQGPERSGGTGSRGYPKIPLISDTVTVKECNNQDLADLPALFRLEVCRFIRNAVKQQKPFYLQYAPIETHIPWFIPQGFEGKSAAGPYGDAVGFLDLTVGAILATLSELGIEQNTLVVFSSDNGPQTGRNAELEACYGKYARVDTTRIHKLRGGLEQSRYEGGIRVPCIIRWTGTIPGKTSTNMIASGLDLFPTFAAAAGVQLPAGRIIDGKNLLPALTGKQKEPVHLLFFGFEPDGTLMSVRYKNWKLTLPSQATPGAEELLDYEVYQLENDPGEKTDVSRKFPEIEDQLRQFGEKAKQAIRDNTAMPQKNFIE